MKTLLTHELKPVEQLTFADDFMFGAIMRNPVICKGVIERLLQIKIDHIEYPELQKAITPLYTQKGVRLDVYVADSDKVFDVECQSYSIPDIGKRTRYYQSMIDVDSLMKGHPYSELKESFILFICQNDPFGEGIPVYSFDRVCRQRPSVDLHDRTHHVIYNCAAASQEEDKELKDFLTFVKSNSAQSDFTQEIASMVETKKFEQTFLNEYLAIKLHENDVLQRGKEEGRAEGIRSTALKMLNDGLPLSSITLYTGLSEEEISSLR